MANIGDVLRHLVEFSPGTAALGNRQELLDAVNAEYPLPEPPPAPVEEDPQAKRIAELELQLAEARSGVQPGG